MQRHGQWQNEHIKKVFPISISSLSGGIWRVYRDLILDPHPGLCPAWVLACLSTVSPPHQHSASAHTLLWCLAAFSHACPCACVISRLQSLMACITTSSLSQCCMSPSRAALRVHLVLFEEVFVVSRRLLLISHSMTLLIRGNWVNLILASDRTQSDYIQANHAIWN